jgi:K+-sensing histidine kinase KdpD
VSLEDDGPGVSPRDLRSVFDPFFVRSGSPQDAGLYLMTCFFLLYHHGGRIEASPVQDGKGVRYVITLPLQPSPKSGNEEESEFFKRVLLNESLWEKLLSA